MSSEARPFAPPVEAGPEKFGEMFLRHPHLFPARQAGEPWDRHTVTVDFAGGPYTFLGLSTAQLHELEVRFGELVIPSIEETPSPSIPIRLFRASEDELLDFDVRGWSYTFDRDYQERAVRVAGLKFMARLDFGDGALSGALWTPLDGGEIFISQVENFFRLLVAYRLLHLGGVLFHSAGVASNGRGYLFLGHSGAGKTTISRLSLAAGRSVLSDDMNALCPLEPEHGGPGRPAIEKLPFAGDLGRTPTARARYPLAGLFRLKKGPEHRRPIRRAQAVAFLIGCAPFVNIDPHRLDRLTDNLLSLLADFPMEELSFSRDGAIWTLLEPQGPGSD